MSVDLSCLFPLSVFEGSVLNKLLPIILPADSISQAT